MDFLEIGHAVHEESGEVICYVLLSQCKWYSVSGLSVGWWGGAAEALQTGGWLEATAPDTNITLLQCCSRRCSCTQPAPPPATRHVWPVEVKKPLSSHNKSELTFLPLRMSENVGPTISYERIKVCRSCSSQLEIEKFCFFPLIL